jgi:hypothetical protein
VAGASTVSRGSEPPVDLPATAHFDDENDKLAVVDHVSDPVGDTRSRYKSSCPDNFFTPGPCGPYAPLFP